MRAAVTILVFCVTALLALGLVMLYSSSMAQVGAHYLVMQLIWCGLGFVAFWVAVSTDYRILKRLAWPLFGLAVVLLILVLIPTLGKEINPEINGARRWFKLGPMRFQPSELAKLALIIALAWYGERYQRQMPSWKRGIAIPLAFAGVVIGLVFCEPDRGAAILMASLTGALLLVAGASWKYLFPPIVPAAIALGFSLWHDPVRAKRILSWLDLEETKGGVGYQAYQSMLALGSGGWTGRGLGNGMQKLGFVPEHHTDFILAIIGEELGLVATLLVVVAFVAIILCGIIISLRSCDTFGLLLGVGITFLIGMQAFINIGVVTSMLPNKGLPLPFISYGGSNLLLMMTCIGLLLSIARRARAPELIVRTEREDNPFRLPTPNPEGAAIP